MNGMTRQERAELVHAGGPTTTARANDPAFFSYDVRKEVEAVIDRTVRATGGAVVKTINDASTYIAEGLIAIWSDQLPQPLREDLRLKGGGGPHALAASKAWLFLRNSVAGVFNEALGMTTVQQNGSRSRVLVPIDQRPRPEDHGAELVAEADPVLLEILENTKILIAQSRFQSGRPRGESARERALREKLAALDQERANVKAALAEEGGR